MGIDRRRNYGIMLDTETANTIQDGDKLDMSNVLPYDFGWAVIDSKGNVYETHSFVNRDIFCYERDLMQSAYYADKIPRYIEDIQMALALWLTFTKFVLRSANVSSAITALLSALTICGSTLTPVITRKDGTRKASIAISSPTVLKFGTR